MLAGVTLRLWFCLLSLGFCGAPPLGACVKETYTGSVMGALVEVFLHSVGTQHAGVLSLLVFALCSGHTWILITSSSTLGCLNSADSGHFDGGGGVITAQF